MKASQPRRNLSSPESAPSIDVSFSLGFHPWRSHRLSLSTHLHYLPPPNVSLTHSAFKTTHLSNFSHIFGTHLLRQKPWCSLSFLGNSELYQKSEEYKLQWKDELEWGNCSAFTSENIGDVGYFQDLIDCRVIDNIRMLIVDSVQNAKAGHPGMALGMAEVGYILYRHVMNYNPKNPNWFNRDRFVLSAGHGCFLQYLAFILLGFSQFRSVNVLWIVSIRL
ncbi:hypothetical protein AMTR_s00009p00124420 [Amborella trichopoda]|uniref:Transketolase N-terminal domain-containing protein n=1 Tax=Amborella trichopoda TaxID=13333 RepID=W1NI45_AMBTC|nr:hypothetical protein AMTR_s00009p00124420 [Amborella trichopoda]